MFRIRKEILGAARAEEQVAPEPELVEKGVEMKIGSQWRYFGPARNAVRHEVKNRIRPLFGTLAHLLQLPVVTSLDVVFLTVKCEATRTAF